MKQKILIAVIILLVVFTGFLRDSFFVHLNAQIGVGEGSYEQFDLPFLWEFMQYPSLDALYSMKWIFTLFFSVIFMGISLLIVKLFFHSKNNYQVTIIVFAGVIIMAGISIGLGKISPGSNDNFYYFSRWLMGAAQSPVLLMLLTLLFYAEKKGMLRKASR